MGINWQAVEPMAFIEDPSLLDELKGRLRVLEAHRVDAFGEHAKQLASERAAGARDERAMIIAKIREHADRDERAVSAAREVQLPDHVRRNYWDAIIGFRRVADWIESGCP